MLSADQLTEYCAAFFDCSPDLETLRSAGSTLKSAGEFEKAQQCFEKALELAPGDVNLRMTLESGMLPGLTVCIVFAN